METSCPPTFASNPSNGGVEAYLRELLKLSPAQVRGTTIQLTKQLSTTVLSGSDEYRVPSDQDLVIFQAHGAYQSTALATEVTPNAIFAGLGYADLALARSNNVSVQLRDKDRNLDMFDARALNLGGMMPPNGSPLFWPAQAPLLVPSMHTIAATFSIIDATAAVVGNAANYSLLLTGVLIPKRM